jgi:hypothetical protein
LCSWECLHFQSGRGITKVSVIEWRNWRSKEVKLLVNCTGDDDVES